MARPLDNNKKNDWENIAWVEGFVAARRDKSYRVSYLSFELLYKL